MDFNLGMLPMLQMNNSLYNSTSIQKVGSCEEAKSYPAPFNSEIVLKDASDDTLLYIKKTDINGATSVKRYRYYEDPEPTQQEINDERYITKEDFNKQMTDLRNDIFSALNKNRGNKYNGNNTTKENV